LVELSDGQAVPTIHPLYVPVHRPGTWAGLETLTTLTEMSDQAIDQAALGDPGGND
jgi:hypothetical protein